MPFDPSKPFEPVGGGFDPNKPFTPAPAQSGNTGSPEDLFLGFGITSTKAAPKPKGSGSFSDPVDLSGGQSRTLIPSGSYYRDPQGNIRRNDNADKGNPIAWSPTGPVGGWDKRAAGGVQGLITGKKPVKKATLGEDLGGGAAAFNRGLLIGDEGTAVLGTIASVLSGGMKPQYKEGDGPGNLVPTLRGLRNTFDANMAQVRRQEDDFAARRPIASNLIRSAGTGATLFVPGGGASQVATAPTRIAAATQGATAGAAQGIASGLLDRGTLRERTGAAELNAVVGAGLGGTIGAATARVPKAPKTMPVRKGDVQVLREAGVTPTPGQAAGGLLKNAEDLAQRVPIVGPAIAGARGRVNDQFNRAVALRALDEIGAPLPKDIKPGFDMVNHVDDAIGRVYDDAADMVPRAALDQQFADDIAAISARSVDLPESQAGDFARIASDRLRRLGDGASGRDIKAIHSELGEIQRAYARGGGSEQILSQQIGDLRRSLMGLIERANPEAGAMIKQADRAWVDYSIMNDAAAAASAKGGVFTPGQLNSQVRRSAKDLGSNMAGKGGGSMQDLATAGSRVLPDQFGNPGTANAAMFAGGGVGLITAPVQTLAAGAGLTAAATPYFLMGRKVLETLPANASRSQLQAAEQELARLASQDPAVRALQAEVTQKLIRYGGTQPSEMNRPRPVQLPTSTPAAGQ